MTTQEKIESIAKRATGLLNWDAATIALDLAACIEGGCSLRLDDMLQANVLDLLHDVCGINKNLNRETYQLENCFYPRFAGK